MTEKSKDSWLIRLINFFIYAISIQREKKQRESDLDDDEQQSVFFLCELIQLVEVCIVRATAFVLFFFVFLLFHVAFVIDSCQLCICFSALLQTFAVFKYMMLWTTGLYSNCVLR